MRRPLWSRSLNGFALLLAVSVAAGASPARAQATTVDTTVTVAPLRGSLHVLQCGGVVAAVASVGPDGVLLVDTGVARTAEALRQALAGLGAGPVRWIVNTHGDLDHVGGNAALGEGADILAHPETARQMSTYYALPPLPTAGLPTRPVAAETTFACNGDLVRLEPVPGCHRASDLIVRFTRAGVVCLGDLVLTGTFADAAAERGGDAQRLAATLRRLQAELPAGTFFVPGHGALLDRDGLQAYVGMLEGTLAAVRRDVEAGHSLAEILRRNPLAPWAAWERADDGLSFADWTGDLYASLTGERIVSISAPLTADLLRDGIAPAIAACRSRLASEPARWIAGEDELNVCGYQLLARGMTDAAVAVLALNVERFPGSFNTHDSLGEALLAAGRKDEAAASYERSLALNPGNGNAAAVLRRLRGE